MNSLNTYLNDEARKKRLGQYFTDENVADLLIKLVDIKKNDKVIDPMIGTGNMIAPLLKLGHNLLRVYGIEIDPVAGEVCNRRLGIRNLVINNAFNKASYGKFVNPCKEGWDVVITNPPYVRYQSMTSDGKNNMDLPSAKSVKEDLLDTLDFFCFLDKEDRSDFKIITKAYSGLADLAVPAWILCAAMLKVGGRLAIVVPDTWLNRDYASVVQYMLLKWFGVEYIVEDVNRVWFSDAQVKTNLVIANRIPRIKSIYSIDYYDYYHIRVYGDKNRKLGPVLPMMEKESLKSTIRSGDVSEIQGVELEIKNIEHMVANLLGVCKFDWIDKIEEQTNDKEHSFLPYGLAKLSGNYRNFKTMSLENLGISVGQGLRTGANKFFYFTNIETLGEYEIVQTDKHLGSENIKIPSSLLRKVVRKQSDINNGSLIDKEKIKGRVLYIRDSITKKDMMNTDSELTKNYSILDDEIGNFIEVASLTPINIKTPDKLIPQLSAVKPNVRIEEAKGNKTKRYWYMLPEFTDRHVPDLFIPRINNGSPNVYLIEGGEIVVDANFSTLWVDKSYIKYKPAYFAILNSFWVKAYLESTATVMGGGALKVEASHIKKIKIPLLDKVALKQLIVYGNALSKIKCYNEISKIIHEIDNLLLKKTNIDSEALRKYVKEKVARRKR